MGVAHLQGAFRRAPENNDRAHKPVRKLVALLATLFVGALLVISSPGLLSLCVGASESYYTEIQSPTDSPVETRLAPSWNGLQWDWESIADDEGLVRVIVSHPEDYTPNDLAISPETQFTHVFNGYSASVDINQLSETMASNPELQFYPDLPVQALLADSVIQIGADELWTYTDSQGLAVTGEGIVVAVIDTGVDYGHPDLGGGFGPSYKVIGGYDFYNHDSNPMDDNGHGTHVAGTIAANGETKGVAPDAKILAYKTLGRDGQGMMSDVIAAIDMAIDPNQDGDTSDRADVISMSLGGAGEATDPVCLAVERAVDAGIVVVAAAGNDGPTMGTVASPGIAPYAITVGAIDDGGVLAAFSSRGAAPDFVIKPEISAPGVGIVSTVPYSNCVMSSPSGYLSASGTSMATPHVSGGSALLLQLHPDWSPDQVKSALITSAMKVGESVWSAGSGRIWLPDAADTTLFPIPAIISCGLAGGEAVTSTVMNEGGYASVSCSSDDWFALSADGRTQYENWLNQSSVAPSSFALASGGSSAITLEVSAPDYSASEGYYDGEIHLTYGSQQLSIPFGFAVLSCVNVHVVDAEGKEVFDPYGGVWAYSNPDGDTAMMIRGDSKPAPPATFFLASGEYGICAAGHQDIYHYDDPYMLSTVLTIDRLSSQDVWLDMSAAREFVLDLETDEGNPIYAQDYRIYFRHEGENNISFHLVGSDYSIIGEEMFSLPHSRRVFISETTETVGVSISGFAYTDPMWDFMNYNWQHWFEYVSGSSTEFYPEASTDLQYLLSWEFDGIDQETPLALGLVDGQYSVYDTKYDIPGKLSDIWGDWGTHKSVGGDSAFYIRRDTDTSVNSFFSGMTRTTYVQGVFSELYFPGSLFGGYLEREFYIPDYEHLVRARTVSNISLPDRNFLISQDPVVETQRLGSGPFYPSIRTEATDNSLVIYHPLLRDQSGAKVGGMTVPSLNLYKNSMFVGVYQLSEFLSRPDAVRQIDLMGAGTYVGKIDYHPNAQLCDDVVIEFGFSLPSSDTNPPEMTSLLMPQRFTPGDIVELTLTVADDSTNPSVEVGWRADTESPWNTLQVTELSESIYRAYIATSVDDSAIDIEIELTDSAGNFLRYTACKVSLKEVPVVFDLSAEGREIGYRNADDFVVLVGSLTDNGGNPLHPTGAVPLELTVNDDKIGMILDEYITSASHAHDGNIRFEWHFNPIDLFSGPSETIEVKVEFDLGIYQPITRTFELSSTDYENSAPSISLVSPSAGSLISKGTTIDLEIMDDGEVFVEAFLDDCSIGELEDPWDVSTEGWEDGMHDLRVVATDDVMVETSATFSFEIDGTAPLVAITTPVNGTIVPRDYTLIAEVFDEHLALVTWSLDGGAHQVLEYPYSIDLSSLSIGTHSVEIVATDLVELTAAICTQFEMSDSAIVVNVLSPGDGAVIRSGVPIEFSATGIGAITCRWKTDGVWATVPEPYLIQTDGWGEGSYTITINASNEFADFHETVFEIMIDDTPPIITLISPVSGAPVTSEDSISIRMNDANFMRAIWSFENGFSGESAQPQVSISLAHFTIEGHFTLNVSGEDLAGNVAEESMAFVMDNIAPVIEVIRIISGDAVAPTDHIQVKVTDPFLASVGYSVDLQAMEDGSSNFSIDMNSLSLGWHDLEIMASDQSGHASSISLEFYIDGLAPEVEFVSGSSFLPGDDFVVSVTATDDFSIAGVKCFFEKSDGGFYEASMDKAGNLYSTSVDSDWLWDGMSIYVTVVDTVGNGAETVPIVMLSASGNDLEPSPDETSNEEESPFGSIAFIASLGVAAAIALISFGMLARRRRDDDSESSTMKRPGTGRKPIDRGPAPRPRSTNGLAFGDSVGPAMGDKHVSILDALAIMPLNPTPLPVASGEDAVINNFEDLERQMELALTSRTTFFEEDESESSPEEGLLFETADILESGPTAISGLRLKKLMEEDR